MAGVAAEKDGTALGLGPSRVDPLERSTSLRGTTFPLKNSEALREGSIEGAGGKMSDWNESDYTTRFIVNDQNNWSDQIAAYLSWHDKGDRFDGGPVNFVGTCNLAICDPQGTSGEEAHSTLRFR